MTNELKPCPFCGGEAHFVETSADSDTEFHAQCKSCGAEIGYWVPYTAGDELRLIATQDVVTRWNTRTDMSADLVRAALERARVRLFVEGAPQQWVNFVCNMAEDDETVAAIIASVLGEPV